MGNKNIRKKSGQSDLVKQNLVRLG